MTSPNPATRPRRFPWTAFVLAVLFGHFIATGASMLTMFSGTMSRFDTGGAPSALEGIASVTFHVLAFPGIQLAHAFIRHDVGVLGWGLFFANSMLWTLVACGAVTIIHSACRGRRAAGGTRKMEI